MIAVAIASLSGGQGKTTASLFLSRLLASRGYPTLAIDADPQHNLTTYLGLELQPNQPTLLEVLKKSVPIEDGIYPVEGSDNLFLIPSDDGLDAAADYLPIQQRCRRYPVAAPPRTCCRSLQILYH
ncbi:AAA family ATPase [Microcoleus sp. BR0-C5]|uniref:AAA family ATPase n=1 Tax=Microcoleus sp. BR0-C5 TaxID=2818713 RepID=UPI002FCE9CCF